MFEEMNLRRRQLLRTAALGIAATQFGLFDAACTQSAQTNPAGAVAAPSPSFDAIKQVDAGLLNIGYAEAANGPAAILLHGWPYDIHSFVYVAPLLAANGYRVVVPHLRGFGTTAFLSSDAFRNAQRSAVAVDLLALMDALQIDKAIVAGYDWGARTANIVAALWPERVKAMVR